MSVSDPPDSGLSRAERVRAAVDECLRRRACGDELTDEAVVARHAELMPELGRQLRMVGLIERAREEAASATGAMRDAGKDACGTGPAEHDLAIPGYRILNEIHRGGQGVVYLADQLATRRQVAVKVLRDGHFAGRRERLRFEREVQILGTLRHPNIVTIYDSGTIAGNAYLVMDYIAGESLDQYVPKQFPISDFRFPIGRRSSASAARQIGNRKSAIDNVLRLFIKICNAVHAAHLRGIIHRDLKPSNIRIDESGEPHVLDFGLAKLATENSADAGGPPMTITGQFVGSLPWAAPEQAEGRPDEIDIRTDVYALGVMLYQMLTGRFPYTVVGNIRDVVENIVKAEPVRPSTLERGIGDEIETIVLKCLAKERERRYQSAGELAADLQRYVDGEPIAAKRESTLYVLRKQLRRYRGAVSVAALFVAVLITFALLALRQSRVNRRLAESEGSAKIDALSAFKQADIERQAAFTARARADEQAEHYRRSLYISRIAQAHSALEDNRISTATTLLELCPADLRGWEWRFLRSLSEDSLDTFEFHHEKLSCVGFTPDGARLFTLDGSGLLAISNLADVRQRRHLCTQLIAATTFAISPDADWFAVSGREGVRLFDLATEADRGLLAGHASIVWHVAVSPDGRQLASASEDRTIGVWDVGRRELLRRIVGHSGIVRAVEFCAGVNRIVSGADDGTIRVWDTRTGTCEWTRAAEQGALFALAVSPDGQSIASAGDAPRIRLWDAFSGEPLGALEGHADSVRALAFSADGAWLASGCYDGTMKLWDVATGRVVRTLRGHGESVETLAFRPQPRDLAGDTSGADATKPAAGQPSRAMLLASGSRDFTVRLWDPFRPEQVRAVAADSRNVATAEFSSDGRRLVTCGRDGVKLWDAQTLEKRAVCSIGGIAYGARFAPDGRRVVIACGDHLIRICDGLSGEPIATLEGHDRPVTTVAVDPQGRRLVSGDDEGNIKVWDLGAGREVAAIPGHRKRAYHIEFSPDGDRFAFGTEDGFVQVRDARSGGAVWSAAAHAGMVFVALFTPDGKFVVSGGRDAALRLWDAASGRPLRAFGGQLGSTYCAALSPDGARVVCAGYNAAVKLYDVVSGQELMSLSEVRSQIHNCISFSPDGTRIAAGARDGTLTVWSAANPSDGLR